MSVEWLYFVFIVLNMNVHVLGTSGKQRTNCSCVNFNWKTFNFSFLPGGEKKWKERVCSYITTGLEDVNVSLLTENATCKWAINVSFPVISYDPRPNLTLKSLPSPVLAKKETSANTARDVFIALSQTWKLLTFCLLVAVLSGIIVWFLVCLAKNSSTRIPLFKNQE